MNHLLNKSYYFHSDIYPVNALTLVLIKSIVYSPKTVLTNGISYEFDLMLGCTKSI